MKEIPAVEQVIDLRTTAIPDHHTESRSGRSNLGSTANGEFQKSLVFFAAAPSARTRR